METTGRCGAALRRGAALLREAPGRVDGFNVLCAGVLRGRVAVVTADRQLADRSRQRGAEVVSPLRFLARCEPGA